MMINLLIDNGNSKGRLQINLSDRFFKIYKSAKGKAVLIEALLKDAYKNEKYDGFFKSKRENREMKNPSAFEIIQDAGCARVALLESLLKQASSSSKYAILFNKQEEIQEVEEVEEIVDDEEFDFSHLETKETEEEW